MCIETHPRFCCYIAVVVLGTVAATLCLHSVISLVARNFLFCRLFPEPFDFHCCLPKNHTCGYTDVHRVLRTELGKLYAEVRCINN